MKERVMAGGKLQFEYDSYTLGWGVFEDQIAVEAWERQQAGRWGETEYHEICWPLWESIHNLYDDLEWAGIGLREG